MCFFYTEPTKTGKKEIKKSVKNKRFLAKMGYNTSNVVEPTIRSEYRSEVADTTEMNIPGSASLSIVHE